MREPSAIKLFIGQIPRDWSKKELTEIFEPFGDIHSLNLLQDKTTGQHKGCAFLIYFDNESAKKAQAELHESKTLPGARNPLQVKPAASETNVEDRTLYIGMLSKKLDENAVRDMFSPFGTIENLNILKNSDGKGKGCAFIKYETRLQAQNAIKAMHNSETMEGCTYPLVVKVADTEKDKMYKKRAQQDGTSNAAGLHSVRSIPIPAGIGGVAPIQPTAYYQQLLAQQMALPQIVAGNPNMFTTSIVPGALTNNMGMQQQMPLQQQQVQVINQPLQSDPRSHLSSIPQSVSSWLPGAHTAGMTNLSMLGVGGYPTVGTGGFANGSTSLGDATLQQAYSGIQQYIASYPQAYNIVHQTSGVQQQQQQQQQQQPNSGKKDGSDAANLFIYHLPFEFNDSDLMQAFMPFGNVISAKVYVDKATGLSKCFGFVSYSNASSAHAAIKSMNGMSIGSSKRLKVQLKRPKEQDKPY